MLNKLFVPILLVFSISATAQFKNDNVLYKTVDPVDLCVTLKENKGFILLDVRTAGEFADTSQSPAYNLGHLKGAINIDVRALGKRLEEISDYRNKPVFVYCSHSQRSRRAGKMLADSGFTKVYNVNGGMTAIHYTDANQKGCLKELVQAANNYEFISAQELCGKTVADNGPFILDVRTDSAFRHISRDVKENIYGAITGTINIPLSALPARINELSKTREIVITDIFGDDAAKAAVLLKKNGFKHVSVLIEGIDRLIYTDEKDLPLKKVVYQSPVTYNMLTASAFGRFIQKKSDYILLDIRSTEEVANKHKDNWRNIGHLKNSINIPAAELEKTIEGLGKDKTKIFIIYSFGNGAEVYAVAKGLQDDGFTNINVLVGGIFNIRWTAGNVKGQAYLKDLVEDVPEANQ